MNDRLSTALDYPLASSTATLPGASPVGEAGEHSLRQSINLSKAF